MPDLPPVRREITVPAPPSVAWEVFVNRIATWWPLGNGHAVFGNGTVAFEEGELVETSATGERSVWAEVLEMTPPESLLLAWHPGRDADPDHQVWVEFESHDDGTRVRVTHSGWGAEADAAAQRAEYQDGWGFVLGQYDAVLPAASESGWYVLEHRPDGDAGEAVFGDPRIREHFAFLGRLAERGALLAAGPLDDDPGAGMTIVHVPEGPDTVRRLATEDDGAVRGGLLRVRIRPWTVAMRGVVPEDD